jgi:hypothetical protein
MALHFPLFSGFPAGRYIGLWVCMLQGGCSLLNADEAERQHHGVARREDATHSSSSSSRAPTPSHGHDCVNATGSTLLGGCWPPTKVQRPQAAAAAAPQEGGHMGSHEWQVHGAGNRHTKSQRLVITPTLPSSSSSSSSGAREREGEVGSLASGAHGARVGLLAQHSTAGEGAWDPSQAQEPMSPIPVTAGYTHKARTFSEPPSAPSSASRFFSFFSFFCSSPTTSNAIQKQWAREIQTPFGRGFPKHTSQSIRSSSPFSSPSFPQPCHPPPPPPPPLP